jgi:hypothetical protein
MIFLKNKLKKFFYLIGNYEILGSLRGFKLEYLPLIRKLSNSYQTKLPESKFIFKKKIIKIFQLVPKLFQFEKVLFKKSTLYIKFKPCLDLVIATCKFGNQACFTSGVFGSDFCISE